MRVQFKDKSEMQIDISIDKKYTVFEIESTVSGETYYRIENDANRILPYDATLFNVVSDKLNNDWTVLNKPNQSSTRLPEEIAYLTFWEDFYNDEPKALRAFKQVKSRVYLEELEASEITNILESDNQDEIHFVLNALIKAKCGTYTKEVIRFAKTKLGDDLYSEDDILWTAFKYLSLFQEEDINDFFVYYLTNIELGNDDLTEIASNYFAS
ncbi:hypothetical protein [Paenibacillus sp. FSL R5-0473]|uniref:hypothetical protein n=1 Tax=Paenibacillus sp. FSL R5-0473 TaxID=2921642 RepID=UPI0030F83D89